MKKNIVSKNQVLITSVYRSGSEFFSTLLNLYPNISSTMYRINFMRYIFNKYNLKNKKINYKKIISDLQKRLLKKYQIKIDKIKFEKLINNKSYGEIYDIIMTEFYLKKNKNIWSEKNQLQWREIPEFLKIMKNGKSIHILRDPRAVMLSYKKFTYHKKPAYLGSAFNSVDAMYHIQCHLKKLKKSFMFVRYEDLIFNKVKTMNKIWDFLNVKRIRKLDIKKLTDGNGKKWKSNTTQISKKFDENLTLNSWKNELSKDEIIFVETICHKYMKKFGYNFYFFDNKIDHSKIKNY